MSTTTRLIFSFIGNLNFPPSQFSRKLIFPSSTLRFHRYTSSSSAAAVNSTETVVSAVNLHHPWPEWVTFIDRLNAKGYLSPVKEDTVADVAENSDGSSAGVVVDYKDMSLLKDACLTFARDRVDILKSLSMADIKAVVEKGCPNLLRKSVNSGKRLRIYTQLDEGDVCSSCTLRGSCDRAYAIPKESEPAARTADIVRILLSYAVDPNFISGEEKSLAREHIEVSARKLLLELIELSEKAPDPEFSEPIAKVPIKKKKSSSLMTEKISPDVEFKRGDWTCPKCNFMNFARNVQCRECGEDGPKKIDSMKKGDWICSDCSFMNFSRNVRCLKCKAEGPKRVSVDDIEMKNGDWNCPHCSFMNFARNVRCLKCKAEGPKRVSVDDIEMKNGDWNCPQCQFMNFASNIKCKRCSENRPKRELGHGEWECPKCRFPNYRKNVVCRKCDAERPKENVESQYEDQIWRKPSSVPSY